MIPKKIHYLWMSEKKDGVALFAVLARTFGRL